LFSGGLETIEGYLHGAAVFGGTSGNDVFFSIRELSNVGSEPDGPGPSSTCWCTRVLLPSGVSVKRQVAAT
jgi:hypothetical protein